MAGEKDVKIRINTEADTKGAKQAEQSIASLETEVKRLKEELRNAAIGSEEFSALSTQLETAKKQLKDVERSLEGVGAAGRKADTSQANLSKSTNTSAGSFKAMLPQIQNTSFQLQDFAVQVGAGTSAMRAFSQQAPQLLSGFGPGGAILGALIAFAPLLAAAFGKARDELRETAKAEEEHKAEVEEMAKAYDFLSHTFGALEKNSEKRIANLEKEQQLAEKAEKAETERAKRQVQNDGGKEIALERIRLATVEAQLVTSTGESAVRLAKEREEIIKRIAAKEKEIAEDLRKKDEASAEKRVTDAQKVVDVAKDDSNYADQALLDEVRARDENARRLQEEKDARARLIAALEAEIEEAKKAQTNRGLAQQRVQDGKLGLDELEKQLQKAKDPNDPQNARVTELEAKAKVFEKNVDNAGEAVAKLTEQLNQAYIKLSQAQGERSQLKQNNDQARSKEADDAEIVAKREFETGTQKAADEMSRKMEGMIEQITASIPDAQNNTALQALIERLRQIEQGGTQEGELTEAEGLIQQLAGQSQASYAERQAFFGQINGMFGEIRDLFSGMKGLFEQQRQAISEMRRDVNGLRQQQGNPNP